ncbi:aminotransferase class I/II-fold pyridoxal phosphate-dependent enzyme [Cohnella soli]|uniref:Aminotransferase class I/II-fold pyridoxal phosphate-dependent enzyme n=1 Tax=Cohnella soli TaxID=425005 RepID=A0ABW0HNJ3_9BACL
MINWMGGWPKEGLISAADWEERVEAAASIATTERFGTRESNAEPYGEKLRSLLAQNLLKARTGGNGSQVKVTQGADGALAWIADQLLQPGDTVLTEKLTSRSALHVFRKAGLKTEAVAGDRRGMDPEALTTALFRYRPKMVYIAPACTDPEGTSWSVELRSACQARCSEAGVLLVTDDRQEMLLFEPEKGPSARRLDPGVLSIGQLPPGLIAGLKLGWIAGQTDRWRKSSTSAAEPPSNTLEMLALSRLIDEQPLEPLIEMLRVQCEERMKRMIDLLSRKGIPDLGWLPPRGGLHLWVTLPQGLDGESLLKSAWLKGLIFQPGAPYYVKDARANTIRLTFAFSDERQMKQGLARLAESVEEFTGRWSRS